MSAVEYTREELSPLVGATILEVNVGPDEIAGSRDPLISLRVLYPDDLTVNDCRVGVYQVWMDEEGNGPGHLALVGTEPS